MKKGVKKTMQEVEEGRVEHINDKKRTSKKKWNYEEKKYARLIRLKDGERREQEILEEKWKLMREWKKKWLYMLSQSIMKNSGQEGRECR